MSSAFLPLTIPNFENELKEKGEVFLSNPSASGLIRIFPTDQDSYEIFTNKKSISVNSFQKLLQFLNGLAKNGFSINRFGRAPLLKMTRDVLKSGLLTGPLSHKDVGSLGSITRDKLRQEDIKKSLIESKKCHDESFYSLKCIDPEWREEQKCYNYCEAISGSADDYFWKLVRLASSEYKTDQVEFRTELSKLGLDELKTLLKIWKANVQVLFDMVAAIQRNENLREYEEEDDISKFLRREEVRNGIANFIMSKGPKLTKAIENDWTFNPHDDVFFTFNEEYLKKYSGYKERNDDYFYGPIRNFIKSKFGISSEAINPVYENLTNDEPQVITVPFPTSEYLEDEAKIIYKWKGILEVPSSYNFLKWRNFIKYATTSRLKKEWNDYKMLQLPKPGEIEMLTDIESLYPNSYIKRWKLLYWLSNEVNNYHRLYLTYIQPKLSYGYDVPYLAEYFLKFPI